MESKPEYDEWYAPLDPFAILVLGGGFVVSVGVVVKLFRDIINNPMAFVPFIWAVLATIGCYILGLVIYHGHQRLV